MVEIFLKIETPDDIKKRVSGKIKAITSMAVEILIKVLKSSNYLGRKLSKRTMGIIYQQFCPASG